MVTEFRIAGNTLVDSAQLAAVTAPFLNRPLSFAQLQEASAAVAATYLAATYRKAGWIVRVYLPQQEIANGTVTIQVVEAHFGQARIAEPGPTRIAADRLLPYAYAAQPSGKLLNANELDRALLLQQDMPGIATSGSLAPGAAADETDLLLKIEDAPLVSGVAGADNTGSRSTDAGRATADYT